MVDPERQTYDAPLMTPGSRLDPLDAEAARLAALLRGCSRGRETSFADLYDSTAPRVFGLVLRVVCDHSQAEEVTMGVYLEAWRQSARFDPAKSTAVAWLLAIAHRRAVDSVRPHERASMTSSLGKDARRHGAEHDQSRPSSTKSSCAEVGSSAPGDGTATRPLPSPI